MSIHIETNKSLANIIIQMCQECVCNTERRKTTTAAAKAEKKQKISLRGKTCSIHNSHQ